MSCRSKRVASIIIYLCWNTVQLNAQIEKPKYTVVFYEFELGSGTEDFDPKIKRELPSMLRSALLRLGIKAPEREAAALLKSEINLVEKLTESFSDAERNKLQTNGRMYGASYSILGWIAKYDSTYVSARMVDNVSADILAEEFQTSKELKNPLGGMQELARKIVASLKRREELFFKSNLGTIDIITDPWATVFLDGDRKGETPLRIPNVAPGKHLLEFRVTSDSSRLSQPRVFREEVILRSNGILKVARSFKLN